MNKNTSTNHYENLTRQPLVANEQNIVSQPGSLDSPPVRPRRYQLKKDNIYQPMVEENSIDSDGSNITNTTGD